MAEAHRALGEIERAMEILEANVEIFPQVRDNYSLLGGYHHELADSALAAGEIDLARDHLHRSLLFFNQHRVMTGEAGPIPDELLANLVEMVRDTEGDGAAVSKAEDYFFYSPEPVLNVIPVGLESASGPAPLVVFYFDPEGGDEPRGRAGITREDGTQDREETTLDARRLTANGAYLLRGEIDPYPTASAFALEVEIAGGESLHGARFELERRFNRVYVAEEEVRGNVRVSIALEPISRAPELLEDGGDLILGE